MKCNFLVSLAKGYLNAISLPRNYAPGINHLEGKCFTFQMNHPWLRCNKVIKKFINIINNQHDYDMFHTLLKIHPTIIPIFWLNVFQEKSPDSLPEHSINGLVSSKYV